MADYSIFVGSKPPMSYATAIVLQLTSPDAKGVIVKSRGKFISKAVDAVEIARNKFLREQVKIDTITINSEEFQNKEGRNVRVSTMEIALKKV